MSREAERAYLKSARQFHQSPVILNTTASRRYDVALDVWDDPDRAQRELDRESQPRASRSTGRAH